MLQIARERYIEKPTNFALVDHHHQHDKVDNAPSDCLPSAPPLQTWTTSRASLPESQRLSPARFWLFSSFAFVFRLSASAMLGDKYNPEVFVLGGKRSPLQTDSPSHLLLASLGSILRRSALRHACVPLFMDFSRQRVPFFDMPQSPGNSHPPPATFTTPAHLLPQGV
ncbi:uncharacterized protein K489DRAFT_249323 [Dissoconium aciculare CBS 342.82]|uniref:Uncharacterized protein n=1 Tax=Dissoconium aciculare CBS 342.82 TaxID=1314786 RepID=A0A6J3M0W1_9PEZI|nr:uncharacterized protein K489DRAFT_249323 [Dissoconium aciculare CBS 342.82]KAF1821518.1 hypothetical protein K489DRAFT_249323 [Dissoconium aciculare CBS 342.82]